MITINYRAIITGSVTLSLFLSGCRTVSSPSDPRHAWTPPAWEKKAEAEHRSWQSDRKIDIDSSSPITLTDLADIALTNNPSTREAWENARAAESAKRASAAKWYPAVTASGAFVRKKQVANQKVYDYDQMDYGPAVELTYLLFDFGGRAADVKEKLKLQIAANFLFNQAVQDLLLEVGSGYYSLYGAQASLISYEIDLRNARINLDAARQKFKAGVVSKLDVLQAESDYYRSSYSFENAKGQVKTAKANLANAMGVPPDTFFRIAVPDASPLRDVTRENITRVIEEALAQRPDIAGQMANVAAKEAAVAAANSDLWPSVDFEAGAGKNWHRYFNSSKVYGDDYNYTPVSLTASWDVFDGFDNLYKKRQAQYELRQERAKLVDAELNAGRDVWTKYYALKTAEKKYHASKAFLSSSKAYYDLALEGYRAGLKSMLDLTDAFGKLSDARSSMIDSRKDLYIAVIDLVHAMGRLNASERLQ